MTEPTNEDVERIAQDELDCGNKIEIICIDELEDTVITIACYRETSRLTRMVEVYQKALTLAHHDGCSTGFKEAILGLHDHKGSLTVTWFSAPSCWRYHGYVQRAWEDECEHQIVHLLEGGENVDLPDNSGDGMACGGRR